MSSWIKSYVICLLADISLTCQGAAPCYRSTGTVLQWSDKFRKSWIRCPCPILAKLPWLANWHQLCEDLALITYVWIWLHVSFKQIFIHSSWQLVVWRHEHCHIVLDNWLCLRQGESYYFVFEKWFGVEKEDGKLEREVMAADGGLGFMKVRLSISFYAFKVFLRLLFLNKELALHGVELRFWY